MTQEQFNMLTILIHDICYSVVATSRFAENQTSLNHARAVAASEASGKRIELARAVFVDKL